MTRSRQCAAIAGGALALALSLAVAPSAAEDAAARKLGPESTLAEWKIAGAHVRSEVAVALARKRLGADAPKLEVATMAMEISGCLSKTAGDKRFESWKVEPTADTCLTAPEKNRGQTPN